MTSRSSARSYEMTEAAQSCHAEVGAYRPVGFAARPAVVECFLMASFVPTITKNLSLPAYCWKNTEAIRFSIGVVAMKQPITIRLDPELLANARICAKEENRTLTNFLETVLKERFKASGGGANIEAAIGWPGDRP